MSPLRYRDDDSQSSGLLFLAAGAVLGLAAGLVVADRFGGFSALTAKLRERVGRAATISTMTRRTAEIDDEDEALEERVLEAFRNDPILSRARDRHWRDRRRHHRADRLGARAGRGHARRDHHARRAGRGDGRESPRRSARAAPRSRSRSTTIPALPVRAAAGKASRSVPDAAARATPRSPTGTPIRSRSSRIAG